MSVQSKRVWTVGCLLGLLSWVPMVEAGKVRTCDQHSSSIINAKASQYRHVIQASAKRNRVNPNLIKAVITAETCFRPNAVSPKGAGGLMQLMPATAKRFGARSRFNTTQNIEAGTRYLRYLLDRYNNNMRLAVAAYNAGEGNVDKYGKRIPPFRETQKYIKQVMNAFGKLNGGVRHRNQYKVAQASVSSQKTVRISPRRVSGKSCQTMSKQLHRATSHRDYKGKRTFYYKIRKRDTLSAISKSTGISVKNLKRFNRVKDSLLRPGKKLKVTECRL